MTFQHSLSFKIKALLEYAAAVGDPQDKGTITSAVNSLLDDQELDKATSALAEAIYDSVDTNWASGHPEVSPVAWTHHPPLILFTITCHSHSSR